MYYLQSATLEKRAAKLITPEPHTKLNGLLRTDDSPFAVTENSPLWMHREMKYRALAMETEFPHNFLAVLWPQNPIGVGSEKIGYFLTDKSGVFSEDTILGACAFYPREYKDVPGIIWSLIWVWITPPARHIGLLSSYWKYFTDKYGQFDVESPISKEMIMFVEKMNKQYPPVTVYPNIKDILIKKKR